MKKTRKIICLLLVVISTFMFLSVEEKADIKTSSNIKDLNRYIVKKDNDSNKDSKKDEEVKTDEDGIPVIDLGDLSNGKKKEYVVDCKDWEDINTIWNIIKLLGPFAYIIFASFDFFKIVMAGDEEAIKKAKKAIPKRLLIFALFLLVPFLVQFIAGNFGSNNANNMQIFKCVVNGRLN